MTIRNRDLIRNANSRCLGRKSKKIKEGSRFQVFKLKEAFDEAVTVDGHHLTLELKIDMTTTPTITISTCVKEVSLSQIKAASITEITL